MIPSKISYFYLGGTVFLAGVFISMAYFAATSNTKEIPVKYSSVVAQVSPLEEELQQERSETYKSFDEDERQYYEETGPHPLEDPGYFERDHPLEEKPLDERMLR